MSLYDRDNATGDVTTCEILPGFGSEKFHGTPMPDCSLLHVAELIDVDETPEYSQINLTVKATDAASAGALAYVYVTVYDINDNAPTFDPVYYKGWIAG